ncbi:H exchange transporter 3 [Golovinomyces cichoracearum]|uniref:Chloride channel protein n=1 Tax=Golovinomyces cichoracearum TaxID=62708 RepID=A0A420IGM0_9PEZI|nr:H exchange transporter 3 [Golovinomyces cichoracearum]
MVSPLSRDSPFENQASSSSNQIQTKISASEDDSDTSSDRGEQEDRTELLDNSIELNDVSKKREKKFSRKPRSLSALRGTSNLTSSPRSGEFNISYNGTQTPTSSSFMNHPGVKNWKDVGLYESFMERPSQRVGYEDLTSIDWIFEYTKERQRLQLLREKYSGLKRYVKQLLDSSQVWIVLILTGVAAGTLVAAIDIISSFLSDLKIGYCSSGQDGGRFYLNKYFCCFGFNEHTQCRDWIPWSTALAVGPVKRSWFLSYFFFTVFSVFFATVASFLVQEYAAHAKHSGIPEIKTILGGFVIRRFLSLWTLIVKSLGLCLAVASGMWLGKEGPLVHVSCCCAEIFMKFFENTNQNEARKREVISAAAAAGISVAFGSPIGGVLFSLEQLSYYFPDKTMWQSFVCAMTGAVTLQALDPFRSGKLVLYQVTYSSGWHGFEMVPFVLLGVFGGIYGGLFIKLNMKVAKWKKKTSWIPGPIIQVVLVALLTALINFPNIYMRTQSSELLYHLFAECSKVAEDQFGLCETGSASVRNITLLILAAIIGFFLTTITFGLQIPAGIILPSMAIGALFGRAIGTLMDIWAKSYPNYFLFANCEPDIACVTPGTYAIVGAAAALGGVTRMTVSIVVIMFELTGALTYVLPIMIAVMLSKWVGDAFGKRDIYESWIHLNEYPLLDNNEETVIPDIPVSQIMTRMEYLVVLKATGHTIKSLIDILESYPYRGFPVISDSNNAILLGYISRSELSFNLTASQKQPRSLPSETEVFFSHQPHADPKVILDLRQWMDQTPLTLPSRSNLLLTTTYFKKLGLRYVLYSDRGVLQGLLTKKDVWRILSGASKTHSSTEDDEREFNSGPTRSDRNREERGLLSHNHSPDFISENPESFPKIR